VSAPDAITERLLAGDRTALARLITWAENGDPRFAPALTQVWKRVGRAERVGVTGPPGVGKSTLVNQLARLYREAGRTVGVLAVDPSSPFTGGALLGDRIRMEERTLDPGVFIRSMASRENHGGLARATIDACDAMDAFGLQTVLIETVGVGQDEYDVLDAADTVLVVLHPGAGDSVQAMKAGLLEVGDVLVVNKADQPGAERLQHDLEEAVHVRRHAERDAWRAPVVACSASRNEFVDLVVDAIAQHRAWLEVHDLPARRRRKRLSQVRRALGEGLATALWDQRGLAARAERELAAERAPRAVVAGLLSDILDPMTARGIPKEVKP
jgi:LAO/AO transport system kinase